MTSPQILTLLALTLAVAAAWARLARGRRRGAFGPSRAGFALRLLLQPALAVLLFFGLFPPRERVPPEPMTVFTAGPIEDSRPVEGLRVALPEAPAGLSAERVPDLASALRRHPQVSELHIVGEGLEARDLDAARGRPVEFFPAPAPSGLVELHAPAQVVAGAGFSVRGRISGLPESSVELLDPSGARIALARPDADGRFALEGRVRGIGTADFDLRLLDADESERERMPLPLRVHAPDPLRIRFLAAAPSPELKYLRRWASDAGARLHSRIGAGAGILLGDHAQPLDAEALGGSDLFVLDARSLESLPDPAFAALDAALDSGLGVLVRIDAAPGRRARARLSGWGLGWEDAPRAAAVHLDSRIENAAENLPLLTRLGSGAPASDAAILLRDGRGTALGHWRARGRGRVGALGLLDSYRLVPSGYASLHGSLWSDVFAALARTRTQPPEPEIPQPLWPESRAALCGLDEAAEVIHPDGAITPLRPDPALGASRCAAFWPIRSGWHRLREGAALVPFFVLPEQAGRAWRSERRREATAALAARPASSLPVLAAASWRHGSPWPWLAAWLALGASAWWMERRAGAAASGRD